MIQHNVHIGNWAWSRKESLLLYMSQCILVVVFVQSKRSAQFFCMLAVAVLSIFNEISKEDQYDSDSTAFSYFYVGKLLEKRHGV